MIAIGMVVCVFALPLKAVKGDIKSKLKKIDYGGSALTLAWAVLILLPLSWYVSELSRRCISLLTMAVAGEELSTLGIPPA
jgi:Na+/H+ antiporter NhaD/arsenite permease-like protein